MLGNWRNWCRLCAKIDSKNAEVVHKMESITDLLQIVNKYFIISLSPFEGNNTSVCTECSSFLIKLDSFKERCLSADRMFSELLLQENISDSDLHSIRFKYGIDNDEIKYSTLLPENQNEKPSSDHNDHILDPLESEIEIKPSIKEELAQKENIPFPKKRKKRKIMAMKIETPERLSNFEKKQKHKRKSSNNKDTDYICAICSKRYVVKHWLELHIREKHLNQAPEKGKEKRFVCSKCPKRFVDKTRLKCHEITHIPKTERCIIPCPQCDRKLSSKNSLRIHLRNIHIGEKSFICEECGKAFVSAGALKEHKISHSEDRSFQCSICSKKFKNQPQLNRHEDRHKDSVYECPHCDVKRNTKASIKLHMVIHSDVKKYKCNYCGVEFKRVKSLKGHLILHAGLRPYGCQFCDRTFANASNCLKHKKNSHPAELATLKASGAPTKVTVLPKLEHLQPKISGAKPLLPTGKLFENGNK
uniref:Putative zn finger n=1 Tax=Phlebotomus kandelakii TaxID=1109342 RepID=A0A6B2EJJ3_9DIPT